MMGRNPADEPTSSVMENGRQDEADQPPVLEQQGFPNRSDGTLSADLNTSEPGTRLKRIGIMIGERKIYLKIVPKPKSVEDTVRSNSENKAGSYSRNTERQNGQSVGNLGPSTSKPPAEAEECEQTTWACGICDHVSENSTEHAAHLLGHGVNRPFACSHCGLSFATLTRRKQHEGTHMVSVNNMLQCNICNKVFTRTNNFMLHMRLHESGRRYFCMTCGKWFKSQQTQLDHQLRCASMAAAGLPVGAHMVDSHKPMRFQCSYCDKQFHQRRSRTIHERVHTGERPYTCGYCGRGFTQSQALTIHIRTHTGEKPYVCNSCGEEFRDSSSLRKHEYIHHPGVEPSATPSMSKAVSPKNASNMVRQQSFDGEEGQEEMQRS